jgi:hypothetical protein
MCVYINWCFPLTSPAIVQGRERTSETVTIYFANHMTACTQFEMTIVELNEEKVSHVRMTFDNQ